MACLSLFIIGLGDNVQLRIIQVIISEQTDRKLVVLMFSVMLLPFTIG